MRAFRDFINSLKITHFSYNAFIVVFICLFLCVATLHHVATISAATIGMMADGEGSTAMTTDLNHLMTELPSGWSLDSISWNGDIAYSGTIASAITAYNNSSVAALPLFLVTGNHEAESATDMTAMRAHFATLPAWNLSQYSGNNASTTNYAYDVGGDTRVIAVNQYTSTTSDYNLTEGSGGGYIHQTVFDWVKSEIKKTTMPHIVVMAHEPLYAYGNHIGDSIDANDTNRDKFVNLLAAYGTIPHFVGHTHRSSLTQMDYENDNNRSSVLGGGIWELDLGAFGTKASGGTNDAFPSLGYFKTNSTTFGDYSITLVQGTGATDWADPTITTKTYNDLDKHIFVNTWTGAGTGTTTNGNFDMKYYVDYTATIEANPDWSSNNSGKWWEPAFDPDASSWTGGELGLGYDTGTPKPGFLNKSIDAHRGQVDEQVHSIMAQVRFPVASSSNISTLSLDLDWDDGVMVWLNGTLIHNATDVVMTPPTTGAGSEYFDKLQTVTSRNVTGTDFPSYTTINVSAYKNLLVDGENVLAYWNVNSTTGSSDLIAAVRLTGTTLGSEGGGTVTADRYTLQEGVNGYTGMTDTYLNGSTTATNYGITGDVQMDGLDPIKRVLMKWDVSSIPATTTVINAYLVYNITNVSAAANGYNVYASKRDWTETGSTWATYDGTNAWGTAGSENSSTDYDATVLGVIGPHGSLGIATTTLNAAGVALVQAWIDGTNTNNDGFFIQNASDSYDGIVFSSSEASSSLRPKLVVQFGEEVLTPANLNQGRYRWRNDDGTETTATWAAAENTAITGVALGTKKRIRFGIENSGSTDEDAGVYTLQYSTSTAVASGEWKTVQAYASCGTEAVCLESSQLSHGDATTNVSSGLSDLESTFIPGEQLETSATTSLIQLGGNAFTELEYSLKVTGNATPGDTYYFKLVKDSAALDVYTVLPPLTVAAAQGGVSSVTKTFREGEDSYTGMEDTYISSTAATTNYGSDVIVSIDGDAPDAGALLRWLSLTGITAADVTAASLTFNVTDITTDTYNIYELRRDWTESGGTGATWNKYLNQGGTNSNKWGTAGAQNTTSDRYSTVLGTLTAPSTGSVTVNLNASGVTTVKNWITTPANNFGFTIQNYSSATGGVDVSSSEATTVANRPVLSITYSVAGDLTAPLITDITSSVLDGIYETDEVIDIDLTFSEPVTSTGSVTVTLDTGGTCTFTVTSATTATCNYTVGVGHTSGALNVSSVSGTINDASSNAMTNFTPTQNLSSNKSIRINPPTEWTAYVDTADDANTLYSSTGNVLNFGPEDGTSSSTITYASGFTTGVNVTFSGTSVMEARGPEADAAGVVDQPLPLYPQTSTDAYAEFGTIVNQAAVTSISAGGTTFTATISNLDTDKSYTIVALGMRGEYSNRWCRYTLSGAAGFANESSAGAIKSSVSEVNDSTTYECGDNTTGYVAKWTNVNPTGTTLTLSVTGVANGGDAADSPYLNSIKIIEENDAAGPLLTNVTSSASNGTYSEGGIIDLDITFSEISSATSSITLTLDSGGTCVIGAFASSTSATCDYTVGASDSTGDLGVRSISGTLVDGTGNYSTNLVPLTNLNTNKDIQINPPTLWTSYIDTADDQLSAEASTGNVLNYGPEDDEGPNLVAYSNGSNLALTAAYSNLTGANEAAGPEDASTTPIYPASGTDAYAAFGTTVNVASAASNVTSGGNVELVISNLDTSKAYTIVALGMRGEATYTDRWCRYTISGSAGFTNASSIGTEIGTVSESNDSTTYNCGNNYSDGYVAKWTNVNPTGTTITLTTTGVAYDVYTADKPYINAVKVIEEADTLGPTITNITSSASNGLYLTSSIIDLDLTFSEPATATSSVTVTLDSGGTCVIAPFTDAMTATCDYTIGWADASGDLTVSNISGSITDSIGNYTTNFTPSTNLGDNKDIVVNPPRGWTSYIDTGDDQLSANASTGNILNFGAEDTAPGNLVNYSTNANTGVALAITSASATSEGSGPEAGATVRTPPVYPVIGTDAYVEFGTKINYAIVSTNSTVDGATMTLTLSNLRSDSTYTIVAVGMRGQYTNRWCRYKLGGASSFTNASSIGTTISTVSATDDSTTYNCGGNYDEGYVAKWTNVTPTGTTLTIDITGVTVGADLANSTYINALKVVEESDTTGPTISNISSDAANGRYLESSIIDVDVTFSEISSATSSITLTLDSGGTCVIGAFASSTSATCNYTVGSGDSSGDLSVTNVSAGIFDGNVNYMSVFTPDVNLNENKSITVGPAPTEYTIYLDAGDDQFTNNASIGNVANYGAEDLVAPSLYDFTSGVNTGINVTYSGSASITEGAGAEDGLIARTPPVYPATGTDAYTEFGTTTNMAGITYGNAGNDVLITFNDIDATKEYTIVAVGMRGQYADRWCSYTLTGATSFTNDSSTGTTISTVTSTDDTTKYNCGDNYDNGYVAKWTNVDPTSTSISVLIEGVADGVDIADKSYLSAIKLVQEEGAAEGTLGIGFVDGSGNTVATPSFAFDARGLSLASQSTTAVLGTTTQKLRITNSTLNEIWSVQLRGNVTTSLWNGGTYYYDFNDTGANATDSGDADGYGGQLTVNPGSGSITPEAGCAATGISLGSTASFAEGSINAITLASSGGGTPINCYWDLTDILLTQTIPAEQLPESYSIDMTLDIISS